VRSNYFGISHLELEESWLQLSMAPDTPQKVKMVFISDVHALQPFVILPAEISFSAQHGM